MNDEKSSDALDVSKKELNKSQIAESEERVLAFWQKNQIFEKSLEKPSPRGEYVFYDGPPFATGLPHYGHILAGTIKDVIPRYRTMRGYHVPRNWGWDCHGLPIEKLVQEENGLNTKNDIEKFGIKKFSQAAKDSVFRYDAEWREIIPRTGRWVDMNNQYTTMDSDFMESVWWSFKKLYDKGLVYEDFKSMHISPLLETPLSNFEVNQAYKDITDISVYVKFELEDDETKKTAEKNADKTHLIAWTTTPWTLFGNVALSVGEEIDYVKAKIQNQSSDDEFIIIAKDRISTTLKEQKYEIVAEMKGSGLVGKKYKPLFDYYSAKSDLENRENGWKIYAGDFVTTEDGTGIVHIAPGFGEDDLKLAQKNHLPFIQHINIDGTFKKEIPDFDGVQAKPKEDPTATDVLVIKKLANEGKLFAKEKFTHAYPHCWRTDAPLLNYALSSWFIKVTDYNDKMVSLNKKVHWVPKSIGEKRFGNWLENVKDWGVSRSRYWGTSMPIWRSEDGSEIEVLGSVEDIKKHTKGTNKYFLMRHGESDHNVGDFLSSNDSVPSHLTEKGKKDVLETVENLKQEKIDLIFCSPLLRTVETSKIIAEKCDLTKEKIIIDDRLKEIQGGIYNGKTGKEYRSLFKSVLEKFTKKPEGGDNLIDVKKRVGDFINDIDKKYSNKNILIVTHEYPIWMLVTVKEGLTNKKSVEIKKEGTDFVSPGDLTEYDFAPIPHDDEYVLDLHRPYIDEITFTKNGKLMRRIPEVFDTWFDSGSMPYAVSHYPFEEKMHPGGLLKKQHGFPADFIAEGIDQTRGWFYTLLALNTALFGKSPYKNVIANGLVLAEDGRKMSKRLKNYPDLSLIFNKFGADAMRYYMLSSSIVQSEPLSFSEKGVDEIYKKIISRLLNVVSFYEMYKLDDSDSRESGLTAVKSDNPLDQWIIARLNEVIKKATEGMENYELDVSCRPFFDFVDDLSTWYIRRSRDRFKEDTSDKKSAAATTRYVLNEFAKVLAPFMPFTAELIYQRIRGFNFENGNKSVHLESWPDQKLINSDLIDHMNEIRELVSLALLERDKVGIKVRQPLKSLKIKANTNKFTQGLLDLIKEEVNVKEIICDDNLQEEKVVLDVVISEDLKEEGVVREITRFIQSLRKDSKLMPNDKISLNIKTDEHGKKLINKFKKEISDSVRASNIDFVSEIDESDSKVLEAEEFVFRASISWAKLV